MFATAVCRVVTLDPVPVTRASAANTHSPEVIASAPTDSAIYCLLLSFVSNH